MKSSRPNFLQYLLQYLPAQAAADQQRLQARHYSKFGRRGRGALSRLSSPAVFLLAAIPLTATADTPAPLASEQAPVLDDELFFDVPVVLSASRLEQPVTDSPVTISVIDRETIIHSGARYIPEVLRLVPGMQVGYSGNEFGDEPRFVVSYHGHSGQYSRQMQVLIDGRSIYEPAFGGINWKAIPININDIERIEVSRGPNLAGYGANSFQAAINIITRTAAEDQGSFIQTNAGTKGIADATYRFGGNHGALDYRVTVSSYNDDGADSDNNYDYKDDSHSNNIDYRLDFQLNNHNSLSWQGGYGEQRLQADRNHEGPLPTVRTVKNTQLFQFLKWDSVVNQNNSIKLQYYFNLYDKRDRYASDVIDLNISAPGFSIDPFVLDVNADIHSERHNLEFTHFINPGDTVTVIWGLALQSDFVRAPLFLGTKDKAMLTHRQFRAFATIDWRISQSNTIDLGAMVENHDSGSNGFSPRLSFSHAFNRNHKLRFGVSQALRSPFLIESQADQRFTRDLTYNNGIPVPPGNPLNIPPAIIEQVLLGSDELKNEKILSREIVYMGELLDHSLRFNARLFYDTINDYIDTLREPAPPYDNIPDDLNNPGGRNTTLIFRNPISSDTRGLEAELDYRIDRSLRLIASGAIVRISSESDAISRSAPHHSYSLLVNKQFAEKYDASLSWHFVESFKWMDARPEGTGDYRILDMRLSRSFSTGLSDGSISLVMKNLLDDYSDYNQTPANASSPVVIQSRLAYIDLRMTF